MNSSFCSAGYCAEWRTLEIQGNSPEISTTGKTMFLKFADLFDCEYLTKFHRERDDPFNLFETSAQHQLDVSSTSAVESIIRSDINCPLMIFVYAAFDISCVRYSTTVYYYCWKDDMLQYPGSFTQYLTRQLQEERRNVVFFTRLL